MSRKGMLATMAILGIVLLIAGITMIIVSKGSTEMQIGGLIMLCCALPAIMEIRFLKIERRLRKLEGKPTD